MSDQKHDMSENNEKNAKIPYAEDNYTHNIKKLNERKIDRRSFMKTMVGASGIFAISTLPWGALAAKELLGLGTKEHAKQKIADVASMAVGDSMEFHYPSDHEGALLIRLSENEFKAYQNACTHLKCPVFWSKEEDTMICPCHHGFFNASTGEPTAGPPRRPLPEIVLSVEGGSIYATGVKRYEA